MWKYIGKGGDDLDNTTNILDLMLMIDTKLQLKKETEALEKQQSKKANQSNQQSKEKKTKQRRVEGGAENALP
jgi:hypothetical protein